MRQLMTILHDLNENKLSEYLQSIDDLEEDLKILREFSRFHKFVFQNELIDVFYEQPIALTDDFNWNRKNEPIYLTNSSIGQVSFSLYVPFYGDLSMASDDQPCTCVGPLPKFYPQESCGNGD